MSLASEDNMRADDLCPTNVPSTCRGQRVRIPEAIMHISSVSQLYRRPDLCHEEIRNCVQAQSNPGKCARHGVLRHGT